MSVDCFVHRISLCVTYVFYRYHRWLLLAHNWPEIARLLLSADVDSNGRVRLADVSAALQRMPELSYLTPASASTTAALLDIDHTGSIHPDSVTWTFALPIVRRWLAPRCSEALEIFHQVEADKGNRSVRRDLQSTSSCRLFCWILFAADA